MTPPLSVQVEERVRAFSADRISSLRSPFLPAPVAHHGPAPLLAIPLPRAVRAPRLCMQDARCGSACDLLVGRRAQRACCRRVFAVDFILCSSVAGAELSPQMHWCAVWCAVPCLWSGRNNSETFTLVIVFKCHLHNVPRCSSRPTCTLTS